jgi:hypothetical protein
MNETELAGFFDEITKISALSTQGTELPPPAKPGEVKPPVRPKQLKAKVINPQSMKGKNTNYTRSNVEAPGTDVTITAHQKAATPPPIRV